LSPEQLAELEQLKTGGEPALATVFSSYRPALERMVHFRMDRRVYGRVDPTDILQESWIEIQRRLPEFLLEPKVSFFVWARQIAWQTLIGHHRQHLGAQKRDAGREVSMNCNSVTSSSIVVSLIGNMTSPSQGAIRDERSRLLRDALDKMDEMDREVLALRHFEHLSNQEVADVLGLKKTAASNRYMRALQRLKEIMEQVLPQE